MTSWVEKRWLISSSLISNDNLVVVSEFKRNGDSNVSWIAVVAFFDLMSKGDGQKVFTLLQMVVPEVIKETVGTAVVSIIIFVWW